MNYKVYKLTSPSQKVYIGITSQTLNRRWMNGKGYKGCPALLKAIKKYGWDNFNKEIIAENLNEDEAKELEVFFIKLFNSKNKKFGYNLTDGGDGTSGRIVSEITRKIISEKNKGKKLTNEQKEHLRQINLGKHHSEETRRKMSKSHKGNKYSVGRKHTEEWKRQISEREKGANNPRARKVICLENLNVYDTISQAREETGATKISECCNHSYKHKSSNGLHWEYYDRNLSEQDYKNILQKLLKEEYENKHHKPSEEHIKATVERSSVSVICVESGEVFSSIRDACRKYNLSPSCVCNCCKGKEKTAGGFHWKYSEREAV